MAKIDIQRKGPGGMWPWLLGAVAAVLVVWALFALGDRGEPDYAGIDESEAAPYVSPPAAAPAANGESGAAAVEVYRRGCTAAAGGEPADLTREHEYLTSCLESLRRAIEAVALAAQQEREEQVTQRLSEYAQAVSQLESSDVSSAQHASQVRTAAMRGAALLEAAAQSTRFRERSEVRSAASEVSQAAEKIEGGTLLLEQRDEVRGFLREAGEALEQMAQTGRAG